MKICITGGAGMIGSRMMKHFIKLGHKVIVIDNLWRGKIENISNVDGFNLERDFYNIDLSDYKNINRVLNAIKEVDVLVHLADIVAGIGYVFNNQYEIFKINNKINTNVFEACGTIGIKRILYAGTACSFPKNLQLSINSVLKESELFPAEPESAYGWSKLIGSLELQYISYKYHINATTLMLHNVYGPNCDIDPKRSQVIPSLIRRILELKKGDHLEVWGSGNQGRAFLYVDDVINGFTLALNKNKLPEIIQLGPNFCTSIKDLVSILKNNIIKEDILVEYDMSKPEGDIGRCADYSLAKETLGWEPEFNLTTGLTQTFNWIKDQLI